jgi:hypothetical protein
MEKFSISNFSGNREDYLTYRLSLLNAAFSSNRQNPTGLSGFLLTPQEYRTLCALPDDAVHIPLIHPGPRPGPAPPGAPAAIVRASREALTTWTGDNAAFISQETALFTFKTAFFDSLDTTSRLLVSDPHGGIVQRTPLQMLTALDASYGQVTTQDLTLNMQRLLTPFVPTDSFRAFITTHVRCHTFAATYGSAIPESEKIRHLTSSLTPCGLFQGPLQLYERDHPILTTQNFRDLSAELQRFADTIPSNATTKGAGFVHSATTQIDLETMISSAVGKALAAMAPPIPPSHRVHKYCWTHGTKSSHTSQDCRHPAEGHNRNATESNKLKGKETAFIHRSARAPT